MSTPCRRHSHQPTPCRDIDGWWFVDYLQAAQGPSGVDWQTIERHKSSVLETLSKTTAHDVLPKFVLELPYHNVFCHWHQHDPGYSDRLSDRSSGCEQSTIHLLRTLLQRLTDRLVVETQSLLPAE